MSNEVALRHQNYNLHELQTIGQAFHTSRMFPDIQQQGQALVKILAGHEMGIAPFASMSGIHIIKGKATIGANIMAALVKGSGKYDYRVLTLTNAECEIEFFQGKDSIGKSRFDLADAKAAEVLGNPTWKKFPKNMLFARALSNGMRWYCPDVTNGQTVYTPEEMGAEVDEEGNVTKQPIDVTPEAPAAQAQLEEPKRDNKAEFSKLRDTLIAEATEAGIPFESRKSAEKWVNEITKGAATGLKLNASTIPTMNSEDFDGLLMRVAEIARGVVSEIVAKNAVAEADAEPIDGPVEGEVIDAEH